jgi:hypothetical protein
MPHKCVYSNQIDRLITEQYGSEQNILEAPEPA